MVREITQTSQHPVSALLYHFSTTHIAVEDGIETAVLVSWEEQSGLGRMGTFTFRDETFHIAVGSLRMMQMQNIYVDIDMNAQVTDNTASLGTVYISINGCIAGRIQYEDKIVPEAKSLIRQLHSNGFRTYVMTGDTGASAKAIAKQVEIPIEHVHASLLPHEKAALIEQFEHRYGPVVMVGDNLNDAAALATSSFGVVVSQRTVGKQSNVGHAYVSSILSSLQAEADAFLLPSSRPGRRIASKGGDHRTDQASEISGLQRITYILGLTREMSKRIHRILWWSMVYNFVALTLSSGALGAIFPYSIAEWLTFSP